MKWFKHLSGSLNNSIIAESIERFGSDGYLVFFGILEMLSDEFDIHNPGKLTIRMKKITKNLQLSRQKTVKILRFFDEKAKNNSKKDVSFFADIEKVDVVINCKRLARLCDNHTQKLLKDTSKLLQSKNEVTSSQRSKKKEVRSKKKEHKRDNIHPCPQKEIIKLYNEILPSLPMIDIEDWPVSSQKQLRMRWRENPKRQHLENWKKFFKYIKDSEFLMGDNDRGWTADLFWIVNPKNFAKILSGKYHKNQKNKLSPYEEFINERIKE